MQDRSVELDTALETLAMNVVSTEGEVTTFIQRIEELRTSIDAIRAEYEGLRSEVRRTKKRTSRT